MNFFFSPPATLDADPVTGGGRSECSDLRALQKLLGVGNREISTAFAVQIAN